MRRNPRRAAMRDVRARRRIGGKLLPDAWIATTDWTEVTGPAPFVASTVRLDPRGQEHLR